TPREQAAIESWLAEESGNIELLQQAAKELVRQQSLSTTDKAQVKRSIFKHIDTNTDGKFNTRKDYLTSGKRTSSVPAFKRPGFWVKIAAAILIIATGYIGGFYYDLQQQADSEIVWQTRSLSYGQTATLRFSDGSEIKLNGGSTLRYPATFATDGREVYLEGEAFFSIARDEARPFVVHAGGISTRVLGTSFNIETYANEGEVQVVVAEGKVAVSMNSESDTTFLGNESVILGKNEWLKCSSTGIIEKGEGDIW